MMNAPRTFEFTTGPTNLPDIGELFYNGCTFGPMFSSKVTSNPVKDNAKRTTKLIEHVISVEGYVTLPSGSGPDANITTTMATLYKLLTQHGGKLLYKGRALDIVALPTGDVAWGPVPEMLEFQPMGGGRSAKVSWRVTVRLQPPATAGIENSLGIMQLNYETTVSYDEAGYSSLSIKGTMEAPMTRFDKNDRNVETTVDRLRPQLEIRILKGIDLGRFRITRRNFMVSRDKRTMELDVTAEEKPHMDLPPNCTIARGSYSVRPAKQGMGLITWLCTLRATYTVVAGQPRKTAWWAFLSLMFLRMQQSKVAPEGDELPPRNPVGDEILVDADGIKRRQAEGLSPKPWIMDFSIEEGLYLDSKTISFSATWRLICRFSQILIGSGVWRKMPEGIVAGKGSRDQANNLWARSVAHIMGSKSWLTNRLDPKTDIIVDMGSDSV